MTNRTNRPSAPLFSLLALVLLAVGAAACSSYSYYDLDLKWGTGFDPMKIGSIHDCHLLVTGAATDDIPLDPVRCTMSGTDLGEIEYSTFADSGSITFTLNAYQYPYGQPNCKLGEGSTTLEAGKGVRMTGTVTAVATTPPGPCQ
jgi:hypothetical protein